MYSFLLKVLMFSIYLYYSSNQALTSINFYLDTSLIVPKAVNSLKYSSNSLFLGIGQFDKTMKTIIFHSSTWPKFSESRLFTNLYIC